MLIGGTDVGSADYRVDISRPSHKVEGRSTISAEPDILRLACPTGEAVKLQLEDGNTVEIMVQQWQAGAGQASVATSGPNSGF